MSLRGFFYDVIKRKAFVMTRRPVQASKIKFPGDYAFLLNKVRKVLIEGQKRIEVERIRTYWETGHLIHTHVLKYERAERGQEIVKRLGVDLGVSDTVLHRCVKFVQKYPDKRKVATGPFFSWSHYRTLIAIPDDKERLRLEKTAARKRWSVDELSTRIREERSQAEEQDILSRPAPPADHKPLIPLRGTVYTYRLVERPNLSVDAQSGLLVDLGFGVYHEVNPQRRPSTPPSSAGSLRPSPELVEGRSRRVDSRLLSAFRKDEIVESRPREDAYRFYRTDRTAKDLYTYAAYVEKVIDGDTLKVRLDLGFNVWVRQVLRLRGLDCPELGTAAGNEAKAFVRFYLKEAQQIIVRSSRSDKYDRYLADIFIPQSAKPDSVRDIYLNNLLLEKRHAVRAG
jgi:endonuclease YncB( thermonuclease family)